MSQPEKILILGGNKAQVPLIEASQREGYYVVLCDNTTTNPGVSLADKHYQENFQNREEVLRIAVAENVKGIVSNSEAAIPIVAYVSEKLNLVGNTLASVQNLNSKKNFRDLQHRLKMFAPKCFITSSFSEAEDCAKLLKFPVVLKPDRSSGSRGTTRIERPEDFARHSGTWQACSDFSMNGQVVIEEFVEMPSVENVIEEDIFFHKGKFIWDGVFTNRRSKLDPMLPATYIYPAVLTPRELDEVKDTTAKLLNGAGISFGQFNIEMYYTKQHELFCIEINARQGGNGIPTMVQKYSGLDMYKLLVTTTMGHDEYFSKVTPPYEYKYVTRHALTFRNYEGIYQGVYISPELQPYVTEILHNTEPGTLINSKTHARNNAAYVDMEFPSRELQLKFSHEIDEHVYPIMRTPE